MDFPNYKKNENSPLLSFPGIAVSAPKVVKLGSNPVFPLFGSFVLPKKEASELTENLLHAVVVLIRGPYAAALNVGKGELMFPDDYREAGENIYGFFNLNLFEFFNLIQEPNRYFVNASILQHVSDVLTVDVVP